LMSSMPHGTTQSIEFRAMEILLPRRQRLTLQATGKELESQMKKIMSKDAINNLSTVQPIPATARSNTWKKKDGLPLRSFPEERKT